MSDEKPSILEEETIRGRIAREMNRIFPGEPDDDYARAADAAIAIIVEVYRNGQASLIEEECEGER